MGFAILNKTVYCNQLPISLLLNQMGKAMKRTVKKSMVLMLLVIMGFGTQAKSQERVSFTAGFGFPEGLNLGLRVKFIDHLHIGAYIGSMQEQQGFRLNTGEIDKSSTWSTFGANAFYHFSGSSEHTELPPWYLLAGLGNLKENAYYYNQQTILASLRIGRAFNFSRRFGIEFDAGLAILLYEKNETKPAGIAEGITADTPRKVGLSTGIKFFFRI